MSGITLRPAVYTDLELLQYWDTQPHVIASDPSGDWNWETELRQTYPWREQLIAELDGTPIGFVQIMDPSADIYNYWQVSEPNLRAIDIWIGEESNLNKGYGSVMMQLALQRCFDPPKVTAVIIDPLFTNKATIRFYKRHGFVEVERRTLGEEQDDCLVMRISRDMYQASHSFADG